MLFHRSIMMVEKSGNITKTWGLYGAVINFSSTANDSTYEDC